jgi:uncharacterized membrane protein (UPF0136 family)
MKKFTPFIVLFALLVLAGGVIGFIKSSSLISLVAAVCFAILLLVCSFGIYKEKIYALYLTTCIVLVLHGFFLIRFLKSYKLMPAGFMVLLTTSLGAPLLSYLTKKIKHTQAVDL